MNAGKYAILIVIAALSMLVAGFGSAVEAPAPLEAAAPEFYVDDYTGTDSQRLTAAYLAAFSARPATVVLPNRELQLAAKRDFRPGVSLRGSGSASGIFLDFPGAAAPAGNAPYGIGIVRNSTLDPPTLTSTFEAFSIRARPTGYYKLVYAFNAANVTLAGLDFGVAGQSFIEIRNASNIHGTDLVGRYGGDNSYDLASSKYKIAIVGSQDVLLENLTLGDPAHDRNQSFVTVNASHVVTVRNSTFYGTRTYDLNTHGTGSTGVLFENNTFAPGPSAKFGAILVGNEAWGADTDVTIRGNTMVGSGRFLELRSDPSTGIKSEAILEGNVVPLGAELVGFGPGGGVAHVHG